ncbi:MAG: thioredoxin fold domain-containing protein [Pseudomonadales bacterium]|jgi:thioredoxin-related protein
MKFLLCILMLLFAPMPVLSVELIMMGQNLEKESLLAVEKNKVFMLYISRPACPYCARLEEQVLNPMLNSNEYDSLVILRELSTNGGQVIDFDGQRKPAVDITRRYEIVGTPTLLFLDDNGAELTQRITGYHSEGFYWYYLDAAIQSARSKIQQP